MVFAELVLGTKGRAANMTGFPARRRSDGYTWDDYRAWGDEQRWQIIGGEAYAMTPAPSTHHQRLVARLYEQLARHFRNKRCEVFLSPVDVRLSAKDVVQPDLLVVCDREQVKATHIEGAPALVVEIISPSSALIDQGLKMRLYARAGVREVWLVRPNPWLAEVLTLDGGTYRLRGAYSQEDQLASPSFRGLRVDLRNVFDAATTPDAGPGFVREERAAYGARRPPGRSRARRRDR